MPDRLIDSLGWLRGQISTSTQEFYQAHYPGGDMLLTAALSHGLVNQDQDRIAVSSRGHARLAEQVE